MWVCVYGERRIDMAKKDSNPFAAAASKRQAEQDALKQGLAQDAAGTVYPLAIALLVLGVYIRRKHKQV